MKSTKKALILVLCVMAIAVSSVFVTLAYLTDDEAVVNTFTVGQVGIDLDEADVKPDGTKDTDDRVKANTYHLIPGSTYMKDPTVHVDANSEDAWLFVKVENGIAAIEADTVEGGYTSIADQILANGWTLLKDNIYYRSHAKSDEVVDYIVFENFKIDGNKAVNVTENNPLTDAEYAAGQRNIADYNTAENGNPNITVTAYAIQMAGFENKPSDAWTALTNQLKSSN